MSRAADCIILSLFRSLVLAIVTLSKDLFKIDRRLYFRLLFLSEALKVALGTANDNVLTVVNTANSGSYSLLVAKLLVDKRVDGLICFLVTCLSLLCLLALLNILVCHNARASCGSK